MTRRRPVFALFVLLVSLICAPGLLVSMPVAAADPRTVDDFEATLRTGSDSNNIPIGFFTAQDGGSQVAFSSTTTPPAQRPDAPTTNTVLKMDFSVSAYGVVIHGFENEALNAWAPQDWSAYEGVSFWLYGQNSGTDLFVDLIDNRNPDSTRDDAERFSVTLKDDWSGWKQFSLPFASFARKEIGNGAPNDGLTLTEVHGWAFGALTTSGTKTFYMDDVVLYGTAPERPLTVSFAASGFAAPEGQTARILVKLSKASAEQVRVKYRAYDGTARAGRDYTPAAGTLTFAPGAVQQTFTVPTLGDTKYEGDESVLLELNDPSGVTLGLPSIARLAIQDDDAYDPALLDDFEGAPDLFEANHKTVLASKEIAAGSSLALPGQGDYERVLEISRGNPGRPPALVSRRFAQGEDWSGATGLSLWFYGRNSGTTYKLHLLDNQALDPGPAGWKLAWSDEFDQRAGTPPDQATWSYELGDGTMNGIPGWGNSELQYYSDSAKNAATDGKGNLVITVRETDPATAPRCYYGPCKYTSARLISKNKAEFAYGRVESRVRVPRGAGLWPAFWALGTDIDRVGWPQTGEIDIMEHVAREPKRVFGTIHGPGYSGGESFGGTYDFTRDVAADDHTYAVEWQPNRIVWYVDGIKYHEATPEDVAPGQWVFNHPFFLLLNVAVGGNFGGPVGSDTTFPQSMTVDYVRVYQARDTAERFEASLVDDWSGWKRITVPFTAFTRSAEQPDGAPNDGLTLSSVHGYGIQLPAGSTKSVLIDQVRLRGTCDEAISVTSTADSGPGSLRTAIADLCAGGTISFDKGLAGATIELSSGQLTLAKNVTIDGAAAPGLTISGGGTVRAFVVDPKVSATIKAVTVADGYGLDLAGGILNNGSLTLDGVTVANNLVTAEANDFWKGGAGIYSGENSALTLRNSTVRDNTTQRVDGGGVYGFFNSKLTIENSTISGNTAGNVGGGLRSLGNVTIVNSTLSGNNALAWHGGAIFHTDGVMSLHHTTIAVNTSPSGTSGGVFVGTFGEGSPSLALSGSIAAGNSGEQCFVGRFGAGAVTLSSAGYNLASDGACGLTGSGDKPNTDPALDGLKNNGGATFTHALLPGSPALDAAGGASCPAADQRGVKRPQGARCDIGSVEKEQ